MNIERKASSPEHQGGRTEGSLACFFPLPFERIKTLILTCKNAELPPLFPYCRSQLLAFLSVFVCPSFIILTSYMPNKGVSFGSNGTTGRKRKLPAS